MNKNTFLIVLLMISFFSSCVIKEKEEDGPTKPYVFSDDLFGKWKAKQIITSKIRMSDQAVLKSETYDFPPNYAYYLQFDGSNQVIIEDTNDNGTTDRRDTLVYKVEGNRVIYKATNDTSIGNINDNQLSLTSHSDYMIDSIYYRDTESIYLDRVP